MTDIGRQPLIMIAPQGGAAFPQLQYLAIDSCRVRIVSSPIKKISQNIKVISGPQGDSLQKLTEFFAIVVNIAQYIVHIERTSILLKLCNIVLLLWGGVNETHESFARCPFPYDRWGVGGERKCG